MMERFNVKHTQGVVSWASKATEIERLSITYDDFEFDGGILQVRRNSTQVLKFDNVPNTCMLIDFVFESMLEY
jgi:hypothetical protein